ncbi:DUF4270 family protein [Cytophagaceae bacterium BD1B2-1]|uniref:DUF4270 family protein n=1 Tax=Xanthocytophaga agilis TaxID=3048010 RepID=A0AAE3R646_9BACT|nr:DUF4270 family protein [Xanthocytophaga agilis]
MTNKNNFNKYHWLYFLCLISLVVVGLSACEKGDDSVGIKLADKDQNVEIQVLDTFTVRASTVFLDSITTGGNGRLLAGRYTDPKLGTVQAIPYFELSHTSSFKLTDDNNKIEYDSLVFSTSYEYWYGDTTQSQTISLHGLQSDLDDERTYYNTSSVPVLSESLGNKRFKARPRLGKNLTIRMSDDLGLALFNAAKADKLQDQDDFQIILHGLALLNGANDNAAVLGFKSDSTMLKLYYHTNSEQSVTEAIQTFPLSSTLKFNQIQALNRPGKLANLQKQGDIISSAETNEELYLQQSLGFATRIDFPSIQQLQNVGYASLNQAILTVKPASGANPSNLPLPSQLTMYYASTKNKALSPLYTSYSTTQQVVSYTTDYTTTDKAYSFELHEYVNSILKSTGSEWNGLLIMPYSTSLGVDRLVFGSQKSANKPMKLTVFVTMVSK